MNTIIKKTLLAIAIIAVPMAALASTPVSTQGTFEGANCIFYKSSCPANMTDGHIAIEPDFVLVQPNGKYLFIPNLDRALKVKYLHKDVIIKGEQDEDSLRAEIIKVKKDGKFEKVWSLEEQRAERQRAEQK